MNIFIWVYDKIKGSRKSVKVLVQSRTIKSNKLVRFQSKAPINNLLPEIDWPKINKKLKQNSKRKGDKK